MSQGRGREETRAGKLGKLGRGWVGRDVQLRLVNMMGRAGEVVGLGGAA